MRKKRLIALCESVSVLSVGWAFVPLVRAFVGFCSAWLLSVAVSLFFRRGHNGPILHAHVCVIMGITIGSSYAGDVERHQRSQQHGAAVMGMRDQRRRRLPYYGAFFSLSRCFFSGAKFAECERVSVLC